MANLDCYGKALRSLETRRTRIALRFVMLLAFLTSCAGARQPIVVSHAGHVSSNVSATETEGVLVAAEVALLAELRTSPTAAKGGLRRTVLQSVHVDGPMAAVHGCGKFYEFGVPESYAILLTLVRAAGGWTLHHWQIVTEGLHGERLPCE